MVPVNPFLIGLGVPVPRIVEGVHTVVDRHGSQLRLHFVGGDRRSSTLAFTSRYRSCFTVRRPEPAQKVRSVREKKGGSDEQAEKCWPDPSPTSALSRGKRERVRIVLDGCGPRPRQPRHKVDINARGALGEEAGSAGFVGFWTNEASERTQRRTQNGQWPAPKSSFSKAICQCRDNANICQKG